MNSPSYVFTSNFSEMPPANLKGIDVAFVGDAVDPRGAATVAYLKSIAVTLSVFRFDASNQKIHLDDREINREKLVAYISNKRILLDVTTLGLGEILHILLATKQGRLKIVEFLYAEPREYASDRNENADEPIRRDYKLTKNCKFQTVQGFAHEYQPNTNAAHVFFLGFEPGRICNAFEQRDNLDRDQYKIQVILGVPAFKAGWEANSIRPHLHVLENLDICEHSISYCQANSIRENYLTLWELYRQLGNERGCFYVSPLGTKPQAVGTALFLLETKGEDPTTSLFYDHPERVSNRSSDIETWHHVTVSLCDKLPS